MKTRNNDKLSEKYSVTILFILLIVLSLNLTIVLAQLTIKPDTLPNAAVGQFYSVQLYTEPKRTVDNWEVSSGSLPPGLTLSKQDAYNAVISGTPSSVGTYQFTVKARITVLGQPQPIYVYKDYAINVEGLAISPDSLPEATEGSPYGATIQVTGGTPPYSWSVTGLSTERTNLTWQVVGCCPVGRTDRISIGGTPLIGSHGEYSVTIRVRDDKGLTASKTYTLRIKEVPWRYSVTVRRLTDEGDESRAVVYLDEIVLGRARGTEQSLFEVTVRRTSGVGNRTFRITPCFVTAEGSILDIPGVTLSPPCEGVVGSRDLVCTIAIQIGTRYPYLSEERDFRLRITTEPEEIEPSGPEGMDVRIVTVSFKGLRVDVRVSAIPVQVLMDSVPLVEGKSTIFKINVQAICDRTPKVPVQFDIRLSLPFSEWDWELPDNHDATSGWVETTVIIPQSMFSRTIVVEDHMASRYVGETDIYLPRVHSYTGTGVLTGDPFIGSYYTASYPSSTPRPKYCIFGYPPSHTGERRESGTVIYSVIADIGDRVREIDEDNNVFSSTKRVVRTRPIRILFYPWAENATERTSALDTDLGGHWSSESAFRTGVLLPKAREQVEFLQAIYPTAEGAIRWNIVPTIRIRNLYLTCWREYNAYIRSTCPCTDCNYPCDDACRDWCTCSGNAAWSFLYGTNGLARMADDAGYDFVIAFRVVGGGGCTWSSSRPKAAYVDVYSCVSCLSHEMYHVLGPMPYDDYSCPEAHQCPEGYWVNNEEYIAPGRCYIMSACGGAPWWIQPEMYRRLMFGWFNPSGGDPMAIRVSGVIYLNGTGRLDPFRVRNASRVESPGLPGDYSIVLLDSNGVELSRFGINATFWGEMYTDRYSFMFYLPFSENICIVELRDSENRVLDRRIASANKPQVKVLIPKAGEIVSSLRSNFTISWEGRDADGDTLYYTVLMSPDGGESWLPIDIDLTVDSITWDPSPYDSSENYVVKVIVSDGFYSSENISGVFTIGPYVQLKVESPYGDTKGSGWYLVNETATFSVAPTQVKIEGLLGILGGYYEFAGWSGDSSSTSPSSTIMMNSDKTVVAMFKPNYTMPIVCLAIVVVITLLVLTIILRRRGQRLPPPPSPT